MTTGRINQVAVTYIKILSHHAEYAQTRRKKIFNLACVISDDGRTDIRVIAIFYRHTGRNKFYCRAIKNI